MEILQLVGAFLTLFGSLFLFLGALGIFRMPDVYNKLHAGTKATTMGNVFTLMGLALVAPGWAPKIALVVLAIIVTNPLSSHALARAALRAGIRPTAGTELPPTACVVLAGEEVSS